MTKLAIKKIAPPQKLLGVLTTGHLVNDFYGVTLPFLLPTLIAEFSLSFFQAGLLAIATSLLSGMLQPIIGYLADKSGKQKLAIVFGFTLYGLGLLFASFSISYAMLLAAFFVYGLGQSTFHAQSTNLIARAFPRARGKPMGIHGIGGSIGNFSAPLVATALIASFTWRYAIRLLAIPGFLMLIFLGTMLTEPPKAQTVSKGPIVSPKLLLLALNLGLIFMTYTGFLTFLPTFLVENGSSLGQAGRLAAFMLFVGFVAQPAGGYIYDRLGGRFLFASSSILLGAGLLLFTLETNVPLVIPIIIIGAAATATFPVALAMGSDIASPENVGASVGIVFGASGVLASFAPALTGYAADSLGLQTSFQLLIVLAILALGVSFFLPGRVGEG